MVPLDVQTIPRMSRHRVVHCSHHPHYETSRAAPWRHSEVTLEPPQGPPLQMLLYFAYPPHSLCSRSNLNYINNSSTLYRTTPSPLPKKNQRPLIRGAMVYYYTTLLYTYPKLFASMFYECTMMTASRVTSVLQGHSNYYLAITGSLRCHLTSNTTFLLTTSVLALNLLDI